MTIGNRRSFVRGVALFLDRITEYRAKAAKHLELADSAMDYATKVHWQNLAQEWEKLADSLEKGNFRPN